VVALVASFILANADAFILALAGNLLFCLTDGFHHHGLQPD
jgi:hypothetical protein